MYGYNNPYGVAYQQPNIYQQQNMQNRLNQMEQQQYNNGLYAQNYSMQNNQQLAMQTIKGRPVSSYDEAKACMIDLDGSMFVFPDVANNCIYTKQILLDGSAELKTYVLQEQKQGTAGQGNGQYVLREDFESVVNMLSKRIEELKEGIPYETADGKSDVKK